MADEDKSEGSGSSAGFILLFFGGIFLIYLTANSGGNSLFRNASSTAETASSSRERNESLSAGDSAESSGSGAKQLSPAKIEKELSDAYDQVDRLKEAVEEAKIWGTVSPFKGQVELRQGNARDEDAHTEYLSLSAGSRNTEPLDISLWRVESYISGTRLTIPLAARLPKAGSLNTTAGVWLEPKETAILSTGESPIGISFHENMCTGYFAQFQEFSPSLKKQCPRPIDEMEAFGDIDLTDDSCYDFVKRQSSCSIIYDIPEDANLSSACSAFVKNELTYAGCVNNHRYDPYFYEGSWRLYFDHSRELWRKEREIIRLLDAEGKTVSVLEY